MPAVFAALLLSLFIGHASAWDQKAMNAQIDQTNFLMNDNCSATLIDHAKAILLTANHCVADLFQDVKRSVIKNGEVKEIIVRIVVPTTVSQQIYVGHNQTEKRSYNVRVTASDASRDLAAVRALASPLNAREAKIACSNPERGDEVYAVGNPLIVLYASVSKGIVGSVNRDYQSLGLMPDDDRPDIEVGNGFIQHTALIAPGSSGGALYNDQGELIGVNVRGGGGFALAVPLSDIRQFFSDNDITIAPCK